MKKYFIAENDQQVGPLTKTQLKNKGITAETLVWYEGMTEWQKASSINELKDLFLAAPPPIPKQKKQAPPPPPRMAGRPSSGNKVRNFFRIFFAIVFALITLVCVAGIIETKGKDPSAIVMAVLFGFITIVLFVAKPKGKRRRNTNREDIEGMMYAQGMFTADQLMDDNDPGSDYDDGGSWDDGGADYD